MLVQPSHSQKRSMTSVNFVSFLCQKEWGFPLNMYVRVYVCIDWENER